MLGAFWSHPTLNLPKRSPNNVEYKVEYKLSLTPELRQSRAWDLPEAQHARKPPPLTPEDPAGRGGGSNIPPHHLGRSRCSPSRPWETRGKGTPLPDRRISGHSSLVVRRRRACHAVTCVCPALMTDRPVYPGKPVHRWPTGAFSKGQMNCEPLSRLYLTRWQPRLPPSPQASTVLTGSCAQMSA